MWVAQWFALKCRYRNVSPEARLEGLVEVTGGDHRVSVGYVAFALVTEIGGSQVEFHRRVVVDGFSLGAGERHTFKVGSEVPWESPLTMPGVEVALRTELEIARAVDRSDLDPVRIEPLAAQHHILDALTGLGFHLAGSNVERGLLPGLPQTFPFYQEIEFLPGKSYSHRLNKLEVSFVATDRNVHVVIELDRRVSLLADRDIFGRFVIDPATLSDTDWSGVLADWIEAV